MHFVIGFQWDAVRGEWKKVGEVTGAAGKEGSQRTSGKSVYEGKVSFKFVSFLE